MNLKYIDTLDSLNLHVDGLYERFETKLVKDKLKRGDVFIDVGAHIGYYSVLAAECVGSEGKVYSFEPEPGNARLLKMNIVAAEYSNVHVYQTAISDFIGKANLYLNKGNSGDHRLFDTPGRESIEVDVISLDEFPPLSNVMADFIKIDVQGVECAVLRGARNLIRRSENISMLIEYAPKHLRLANSSGEEMIRLLKEMGFVIYMKGKNILIPAVPERLKPYSNKHVNLYCIREK